VTSLTSLVLAERRPSGASTSRRAGARHTWEKRAQRPWLQDQVHRRRPMVNRRPLELLYPLLSSIVTLTVLIYTVRNPLSTRKVRVGRGMNNPPVPLENDRGQRSITSMSWISVGSTHIFGYLITVIAGSPVVAAALRCRSLTSSLRFAPLGSTSYTPWSVVSTAQDVTC
jgi:hypothetical protein